LRNGLVDDWLRRHLGDAGLAMRIEEMVRLEGGEPPRENASGDALRAMTAVALVDRSRRSAGEESRCGPTG
jgi:hypothetical protein